MKIKNLMEKVVDKGYADFVRLKSNYMCIDAMLVNTLAKIGILYSVAQVLYVRDSEDIYFEPDDLRNYLILETRFYLVERKVLKQNRVTKNEQQTTGLQLTVVR